MGHENGWEQWIEITKYLKTNHTEGTNFTALTQKKMQSLHISLQNYEDSVDIYISANTKLQ